MAFDWNDYLLLAKDLAGHDAEIAREARQRTAISRAYYSAFNAMLDRECRKGMARANAGVDHHRLQVHLIQTGRSRMAEHLYLLRKLRNRCDYDQEFKGAEGSVRHALWLASELLRE